MFARHLCLLLITVFIFNTISGCAAIHSVFKKPDDQSPSSNFQINIPKQMKFVLDLTPFPNNNLKTATPNTAEGKQQEWSKLEPLLKKLYVLPSSEEELPELTDKGVELQLTYLIKQKN